MPRTGSKRPIGTWAIAIGALVVAAFWSTILIVSYLGTDDRDHIATMFELGLDPIYVTATGLLIGGLLLASAIGLVVRWPTARIAILGAFLLLAVVNAQFSMKLLALFQEELPDQLNQVSTWVSIFGMPSLSLILGVAVGWYLYSGRTRNYFQEKTSALVA